MLGFVILEALKVAAEFLTQIYVRLGSLPCRAFPKQSLSAAALFLDLKEAFYRVVRQLAAPIADEHLDLAQLGARFGLDDQAIGELFGLLQEKTAVQEAQLPWTYQQAIAAVHSHTWFCFHEQDDKVATSHGSRPGDSFAHILFGFVYSRVLKAVEEQLLHMDILTTFADDAPGFEPPVSGSGRVLLGPTWMDDSAIQTVGEKDVCSSQRCTGCLPVIWNDSQLETW